MERLFFALDNIPYLIGNQRYAEKKHVLANEKYGVTKQQTSGEHPKLKYTIVDDHGKEIASLTGYKISPKEFYIKQIKSNNKRNGARFVGLWNIIEDYLQALGFETIRTRTLIKLASLTKRLGFKPSPKRNSLLSRLIFSKYVIHVEKNI